MQSITINLCGDTHTPAVKVLQNTYAGAGHFAVLDMGETSVILPGFDYTAVAYLHQLSDLLATAAADLETTLAEAAREVPA